MGLLWAPSAVAKKDPNPYIQRVFKNWNTYELDVIVVPPQHGQIYNEDGPLGGNGPEELTPFNSYLAAVENSVADWEKLIRRYGPKWIRKITFNTYVVGRDEIPEEARSDPEAIIVANEHQTFILGVTFSMDDPECVISTSMFFLQSFNYADMYSVNAHEFGHCLGLEHTEPADDVFGVDLMSAAYEHNPGTAGVKETCPSNLNVKGIFLTFAEVFGKKPASDEIVMARSAHKRYPCDPVK